jgi:hypothetical protein
MVCYSKEKQLVAKDLEQCLSWTYYELAIGMILQIHMGHISGFATWIVHMVYKHIPDINISYTVSSVDAQKLNPENLIDCTYIFWDM